MESVRHLAPQILQFSEYLVHDPKGTVFSNSPEFPKLSIVPWGNGFCIALRVRNNWVPSIWFMLKLLFPYLLSNFITDAFLMRLIQESIHLPFLWWFGVCIIELVYYGVGYINSWYLWYRFLIVLWLSIHCQGTCSNIASLASSSVFFCSSSLTLTSRLAFSSIIWLSFTISASSS